MLDILYIFNSILNNLSYNNCFYFNFLFGIFLLASVIHPLTKSPDFDIIKAIYFPEEKKNNDDMQKDKEKDYEKKYRDYVDGLQKEHEDTKRVYSSLYYSILIKLKNRNMNRKKDALRRFIAKYYKRFSWRRIKLFLKSFKKPAKYYGVNYNSTFSADLMMSIKDRAGGLFKTDFYVPRFRIKKTMPSYPHLNNNSRKRGKVIMSPRDAKNIKKFMDGMRAIQISKDKKSYYMYLMFRWLVPWSIYKMLYYDPNRFSRKKFIIDSDTWYIKLKNSANMSRTRSDWIQRWSSYILKYLPTRSENVISRQRKAKPWLQTVLITLLKNRKKVYKQFKPRQRTKYLGPRKNIRAMKPRKKTRARLKFDRVTNSIFLNYFVLRYRNIRRLILSQWMIYSKYPIYKSSSRYMSSDFFSMLKRRQRNSHTFFKKKAKKSIRMRRALKSFFFRRVNLKLRRRLKKKLKKKLYDLSRLNATPKVKRKLVNKHFVLFFNLGKKFYFNISNNLVSNWIKKNVPLDKLRDYYNYRSKLSRIRLDLTMAIVALYDPKSFERIFKDDIKILKSESGKHKFYQYLLKDNKGIQRLAQTFHYYLGYPLFKSKLEETFESVMRQIESDSTTYKSLRQIFFNSLFKAYSLFMFSKRNSERYNILKSPKNRVSQHFRTLYGFIFRTDKYKSYYPDPKRSFLKRKRRRRFFFFPGRMFHDRRAKIARRKFLSNKKKDRKNFLKDFVSKGRNRFNPYKRYLMLKIMGLIKSNTSYSKDWIRLVWLLSRSKNHTSLTNFKKSMNTMYLRLPYHMKRYFIYSALMYLKKKKGIKKYNVQEKWTRSLKLAPKRFRTKSRTLGPAKQSQARLSRLGALINKTRFSFLNNYYALIEEIYTKYAKTPKTSYHKKLFTVFKSYLNGFEFYSNPSLLMIFNKLKTPVNLLNKLDIGTYLISKFNTLIVNIAIMWLKSSEKWIVVKDRFPISIRIMALNSRSSLANSILNSRDNPIGFIRILCKIIVTAVHISVDFFMVILRQLFKTIKTFINSPFFNYVSTTRFYNLSKKLIIKLIIRTSQTWLFKTIERLFMVIVKVVFGNVFTLIDIMEKILLYIVYYCGSMWVLFYHIMLSIHDTYYFSLYYLRTNGVDFLIDTLIGSIFNPEDRETFDSIRQVVDMFIIVIPILTKDVLIPFIRRIFNSIPFGSLIGNLIGSLSITLTPILFVGRMVKHAYFILASIILQPILKRLVFGYIIPSIDRRKLTTVPITSAVGGLMKLVPVYKGGDRNSSYYEQAMACLLKLLGEGLLYPIMDYPNSLIKKVGHTISKNLYKVCYKTFLFLEKSAPTILYFTNKIIEFVRIIISLPRTLKILKYILTIISPIILSLLTFLIRYLYHTYIYAIVCYTTAYFFTDLIGSIARNDPFILLCLNSLRELISAFPLTEDAGNVDFRLKYYFYNFVLSIGLISYVYFIYIKLFNSALVLYYRIGRTATLLSKNSFQYYKMRILPSKVQWYQRLRRLHDKYYKDFSCNFYSLDSDIIQHIDIKQRANFLYGNKRKLLSLDPTRYKYYFSTSTPKTKQSWISDIIKSSRILSWISDIIKSSQVFYYVSYTSNKTLSWIFSVGKILKNLPKNLYLLATTKVNYPDIFFILIYSLFYFIIKYTIKVIIALIMLWVACLFLPISLVLIAYRAHTTHIVYNGALQLLKLFYMKISGPLNKTLNKISETSLYEDTIGWVVHGVKDIVKYIYTCCNKKIKKSSHVRNIRQSISEICHRISTFIKNDLFFFISNTLLAFVMNQLPLIIDNFVKLYTQEIIPIVLGFYKGIWLLLKSRIIRIIVWTIAYAYYIQTITIYRVRMTLFDLDTHYMTLYDPGNHEEIISRIGKHYTFFVIYLISFAVIEWLVRYIPNMQDIITFYQFCKKNNLGYFRMIHLQEKHLPITKFITMLEELVMYQLPWRISDFIFRETALIPVYIINFIRRNTMLLKNAVTSTVTAFSTIYLDPACIFKFNYYKLLNKLTEFFTHKITDYIVTTMNNFLRECEIHFTAVILLNFQIEITGVIPGNAHPVRPYFEFFIEKVVKNFPIIGNFVYGIYRNFRFVFLCFIRFFTVFLEMEEKKFLEEYHRIRSILSNYRKFSNNKINGCVLYELNKKEEAEKKDNKAKHNKHKYKEDKT